MINKYVIWCLCADVITLISPGINLTVKTSNVSDNSDDSE